MVDYDNDGVRIFSEKELEEFENEKKNPSPSRGYEPGDHLLEMLAASFVARPFGHNFPPRYDENGDC